MAIPWPKILTAITVPSGGWDFEFIVTTTTSLDTPLTATIPAGTYYIAWDYQSDCLLYELAFQMHAAIVAGGLPADQHPVAVFLDADNKVNIKFSGDGYTGTQDDVELTLSATNTDLRAALGFGSSDVQGSGSYPTLTADYQHGYGWYAAEDGQLKSLQTEDHFITRTSQSISYSGFVSSQQIGSRFVNMLELDWLTRAQTWSRGVDYGGASVNPYNRNEALECWFREAAKGTQFRVYRDGRNRYTNGAIVVGAATSASTTAVVDSARAWDTDPQEHVGRLCETTHEGTVTTSAPVRFYVSANAATSLTAANAAIDGAGASFAGSSIAYYVLDQRYQTYVLDIERMQRYEPTERQEIDRYSIEIPLLRYES